MNDASPVPEPQAQTILDDALGQLETGAFEDIPHSEEGLLGKVKSVVRTMQGRGLESLKSMVSMSVNLNEAVTASAEMIRDTREVDNRS